MTDQAIFLALAEAARTGKPVTLGVITRVNGSSPQKTGAKAVFHADSRITGTLGGGCLEAELQRRALEALRTGQASQFDLLLDHDFGWDDGLVCGGKVEGLILPNAQAAGEEFWRCLARRESTRVWGIDHHFRAQEGRVGASQDWLYQETVRPPFALWIAGAGHVAQAVTPLALELDFNVTVMDDRPAMVSHRLFPAETHLVADAWDTLLKQPMPAGPSFGLIVTRGHRHDALVLREWIHMPFAFLGMIGSRRKARMILEHFIAEQIASPEQLKRVVCPVGLPIGSRTVPEIAVSIVAQLIQERARLTLA